MKKFLSEKRTHQIFEIGIILKGIHSILEIIGGVFAFFVTKAFVISTVLAFTQEELSEDPKDFIAHYLISMANSFSVNTKYFVAFYLFGHGVIKLFLVIGLMRKKLWAYPSSIIVFTLFIVYQIYRYFQTFSIGLLLLTVLDLIVVILTIHEYRYMKANKLFSK